MRAVRAVALKVMVAVLGLIPWSQARAQAIVELTPFFASYFPLSDLGVDPTVLEDKVAQTPGAALGATLGVWITSVLSLEGSFTYAFSRTLQIVPSDVSNPSASFGSQRADVLMATGRVAFRVQRRTNLQLFVGGGMLSRTGAFWERTDIAATDLTNATGVAGLRVRANVTPTLPLALGIEGYLTGGDLDGPEGTAFESKVKSEVLLSVGVPIGFGRR